MLYRIFFFLLLLLLLPDGYLYARFLRRRVRSRLLKGLYWVPSLLLAALLVGLTCGDNFSPARSHWIGLYMLVYLAVVVPKTLMCLFVLLGQCLRPLSRRADRMLTGFGGVAALLVLGMVIYGGTAGWRHFQVREVTFSAPDLPPAFDGYRIVQFSDLHVGTFAGHSETVKRIVELINTQEADAVVFTGDLVNHRADELDGVEHLLAAIRAKDGVYSVLGNHDYGMYLRWDSEEAREANMESLKRREAAMGWRMLNNEHVLLRRSGEAIALVGVENDGNPPFPQRGDLTKALRGTEGLFKILLSHDPTHWRREVLPRSDVRLTLSGHTHAMQFMVGGHTPATWFYPESHGMYTEGDRSLYVNIGLGEVMLPFRFGAWPEITVLTLRRQ